MNFRVGACPDVSIPTRGEVREFCLDCTKETTFNIANKLWDLIDPAEDEVKEVKSAGP